MHDMAKRDRNHPSVIVNSLCNEVECLNTPETGVDFVAASKSVDPSRPTTSNSNKDDGLSAIVDVQVSVGWSIGPHALRRKCCAATCAGSLSLS